MAKTKNKKKNLADTAVQRKRQEAKKPINPFEVHINKDKQKVLGRKTKADRGLPGVARAKAISKRKQTLLQEFAHRDKSNVFVDKRIGERNAAMSQEERAMARYAAEQMRAHKKNIYSLNDEEVLTHRGQTLEEVEKFEDPRSDDEFSDEENRKGHLEKNFVADAHFGGGVLSKPDAPMSRKDLIDQLIAESKKRKAERQKLREQTVSMTEKLDAEWKDLLPLMSVKSKTDEAPKARADDFDVAVRELKFETRAAASERLRSEEEVVKEEVERLEALERDRLMRMKGVLAEEEAKNKHKSADDLDDGFDVENIEEDGTLAYDEDGNIKSSTKKSEEAGESGDEDERNSENDEEDEVEDAEEENEEDEQNAETEELTDTKMECNGIKDTDEISENEEAEKSEKIQKIDKGGEKVEESKHDEESEDDDDNLSDLKESEASSDDEEPPKSSPDPSNQHPQHSEPIKIPLNSSKPTENPSEGESEPAESLKTPVESSSDTERLQKIREDLQKRKEVMEKARQELPYTYKAPESFEELKNLLKSQNPDYQSIILERIVKCNHWTLGQGNREKLCRVFDFLLQYIMDCAHVTNGDDVVRCFEVLDRVCPHLFDLAQADAANAATCVQNLLKQRHEEFEKNQKKFPGVDTLILFKVISLLFPTSDFRHPVVTPAIVFMSQILLRCKVKGRVGISRGIFLTTLLLEFTALSKRFSPAAINFLRGVVFLGTKKPPPLLLKAAPPFKSVGEAANLLVLREDQQNLRVDVGTPQMRATDLLDGDIDDDFRVRAFLTAVNLVGEFKRHLEELEAAAAIFEPIVRLLRMNSLEGYPESVRGVVRRVTEDVERLEERRLEFLVREKKRPKALRLYEPRIERVYDGKKHRPMSKEKAEKEKLLHKLKRETKGAIREVRRDAAFLAKVQIKNQVRSDAERKRRVNEIFSEGAAQQAELNQIKRKK